MNGKQIMTHEGHNAARVIMLVTVIHLSGRDLRRLNHFVLQS